MWPTKERALRQRDQAVQRSRGRNRSVYRKRKGEGGGSAGQGVPTRGTAGEHGAAGHARASGRGPTARF